VSCSVHRILQHSASSVDCQRQVLVNNGVIVKMSRGFCHTQQSTQTVNQCQGG
jgi:hypothetical protein